MIWIIIGKVLLLALAGLSTCLVLAAGGLCEQEPRHIGKWSRFGIAAAFVSIACAYIAGAI